MKNTYVIGKKVRFLLSEKSLERISDGTKTSLRTPASFCLKLLLENQGKLVTHDQLYYSGWECFGMTASLSVLHNTIYYLRKNLNEIGGFDGKIIETINRRGFVFSLKVNVSSTVLDQENTDIHDYLTGNINENQGDVKSDGVLIANSDTQIPSLKDNGITDEMYLDEIKNDTYEIPNDSKFLNVSSSKEKTNLTPAVSGSEKEEGSNYFYVTSLTRNITIIKSVVFFSWLALMFFVFFSNSFVTNSFPSSYSYSGKLEGCDVYQNNLSYDFKNLHAVDYIRNYCKSERYLYISYYPYINKLSAINCRRKVTLFSNDVCFSNYFIFKNNGLKHV